MNKHKWFISKKTSLGIIALLLIILAATVFIYNQTLNQLATSSCSDFPDTCPHEKVVKTQNMIIFGLIFLIALVVFWIFLQVKENDEPDHERISIAKSNPRKSPLNDGFDEDERKVIQIIRDGGGAVFQSDLNKKLGYSKVKVSRILDKLEHKGILERKRRGMANLVVMK